VNRYERDVLATTQRRRREVPVVEAARGLVVEDASGRFCGAVVECEKDAVRLEDRHGNVRVFPLVPAGFLRDGEPVTLTRQRVTAPGVPTRTASGSVAISGLPARIARASRIYVEGPQDADLIERVWGADLRLEGVVVEYLEGVDELAAVVRQFRPDRGRRLGVLFDHLVDGSKESRIAASISSPHVLVLGHPYVDVWQAVRPQALGIPAWPTIARGTSWKAGVCEEFGWPHDTPADIAGAWRRILASVNGYADLEPSLLGRVEELIDFVTAA
jgi:hypothetical protein